MKKTNKINNAARNLRMLNITLLCTGLVALGNPKLAYGQYFSGPTANAMGGAGRAAGGPESHVLNPASLVHTQDYNLAYYYRYQSLEGFDEIRDWSLNIVDGNKEGLFRAGLLYNNQESKLLGSKIKEESYILSGSGWLLEQVSLGIQLHRWSYRPPSMYQTTVYQASLGLLYVVTPEFGIGFTAYNILDNHRAQLRPEISFGLNYLYEELFQGRIDLVYPTKFNPRKKGIISIGGETALSYGLKFRFGSKFDDVAKQTFVTTGLGWQGPRFSLAYAYEKDIRAKDNHRQSFDLNIYF